MFALCLRRCRYDMSSLDPNSVHMSSSRKRMCSLVRLQIFVHAFASAWRVLLDSILHSYQNALSSTLLLSHAQRCAVFEDALDYSDDSDYMEEVDRLSNTLVLTGPPGVSSLYLKECVVVLVGSPSSIPTDQISLCLFFFHTCTWSSPSPLLVAFSVISFFFLKHKKWITPSIGDVCCPKLSSSELMQSVITSAVPLLSFSEHNLHIRSVCSSFLFSARPVRRPFSSPSLTCNAPSFFPPSSLSLFPFHSHSLARPLVCMPVPLL